MAEKNSTTATTTNNSRGKVLTALALVAFVTLVFILTILKFAKVW